MDVNPTASIKDTTASILGLNHIGLSVRELDKSLLFYQEATGFELVSRETVAQSEDADLLFGRSGVACEVAVLRAPNMLFELTEFKHNANARTERTPPEGPGMTHTCFQSPAADPGWEKFMKAGARPLSRGGKPIDLGGYGVTYGYAYDPEGNMMELEQLDGEMLSRGGYDMTWKDLGEAMWISQVALVTHDIDRLMGFYRDLLGFEPYRKAGLKDNIRADEIADIENLHILGGWFKLNAASKVIEIWQYINPETAEFKGKRDVTDLGYSFSLEVGDIRAEHERLIGLGLEFVSEPVRLGEFWQTFTHDVDGNVFALRQAVDADSELSIRKLDRTTAQ